MPAPCIALSRRNAAVRGSRGSAAFLISINTSKTGCNERSLAFGILVFSTHRSGTTTQNHATPKNSSTFLWTIARKFGQVIRNKRSLLRLREVNSVQISSSKNPPQRSKIKNRANWLLSQCFGAMLNKLSTYPTEQTHE